MIKKLRQKIFLLIFISLSVIMLGTIFLYTLLNYNNTINTMTSIMNRFMSEEIRKFPNDRLEDYKLKTQLDVDGVYIILANDSIGTYSLNTLGNKQVNSAVIKILEKDKEKGIIDNYIYNVRKLEKNTKIISIIEDKDTVIYIRVMFIFSGIISCVFILIIYIIGKKVSKKIIEPVEETFEKQKQFISDASHELKTPLAVIEANADVLESSVGKNKWLDYIQNEIECMNKLINELLLLAKIENVDNVKEYKEFDLSKEVEIQLSMFESMAYENEVIIKSNILEGIVFNGNKEDIEHIISTLTDNAIKHTKKQNEVIINLLKEKNDIILEVKNMGDAIPEEEREKIFERFYRIDKSRNRKEKRYGLGLAIAKSIVEKYNGKIEVDYKNNFTIFKVTIPN